MRRIALTTPATGTFRPPRRRPRVGHVLAIAGVLAVLAGISLAAMSAIPRTAPAQPGVQGAGPAALSDTLLVTRYSQAGASSGLWALPPGAGAFQPLLDSAGQPVVAANGRLLVATRVTLAGDTVRISVVALDAGSLAPRWETDVASFPFAALSTGNLSSAGASVAVTADRVYVSPSVWGSVAPLTVVALDRASGRELTHWTVDTGGATSAGVRLLASSDGATLYLLDATFDPVTHQTTAEVYLRIRTADGRLVDRHDLTGPDGKPFYPADRTAADGRTVYGIGAAPSPAGSLAIQFFDVATGTPLPPLELPLADNGNIPDHEEATSPDGRMLYVLDASSAELAVVDLPARAVRQVVPVEGLASGQPSLRSRVVAALRGLVVQDAAAKFSFNGDMQLSPDGKRLYAVGVVGSGYEGVPTGVVAIDIATWRVIDRWLPDAQVGYLELGADGHTLYVETVDPSSPTGAMSLALLDTRTGVVNPVAGTVPGYAYSLRQLYRDSYGRAPSAAGVVAAPIAPLARLDVSLNHSSILAGDAVTVDARFVDPATGQPIVPGETDVAYQSPASVSATFYHGQIGPGDVVVALQPAGYGHYRGSATLTDPTAWSLQVDATRENAPGSRASIASAVAVQAAVTGSDGRRYMLRLTIEPASPLVDRVATVRGAFVDAELGTSLPDGVGLAGGTPASIDAGFFLGSGDLGQAREVISVTLRPAGHGAYAATVSLDQAGGWTAQVDFAQGKRAVYALAGTVQVALP